MSPAVADGGARPFEPRAFAGRVVLLVAFVLVVRAGIVFVLARLGQSPGYRWDSFMAAVPGMLAGIVLASPTPRRPRATWPAILQVAVAVAMVHLALSVVMGRLVGWQRTPPAGLVSLVVAAFNAGLAVGIGAWAGAFVSRLSGRLSGTDGGQG